MPLWRCPHCATPQPESARCWLCGKSTTTCVACRHYRRGVTPGFGLCALQPRKLALRGTEILPCWEAKAAADDAADRDTLAGRSSARTDPAARPSRTFVPVEEVRAPRPEASQRPAASLGSAAPVRWSLWGDPEA